MNPPIFEIVTTSAGVVSIRNNVVNEIMHNPVGPWVEANALYIEQSHLAERLREGSNELVVFDVGLGAAANALAALHCWRQVKAQASLCRPLRLVSFEIDLDLLRFALAHAHEFAHFQGYEKIIETLLEKKIWTEEGLIWELREGDFLNLIRHEPCRAHLIFYDPYSPKKNTDMWGQEVFELLRQKTQDASTSASAMLFTYSQATPIRAALLAAGFFVGYGQRTGLKEETTQASTILGDLELPLDQKWLSRWQKSRVPYPYDAQEKNYEALRDLILKHQQFSSGVIQPNVSLTKPR